MLPNQKKTRSQRYFIWSLLTSLFLSTPLLYADEPEILRQSPRARGMGGAFTAVANDDYVLYYNPAGLQSLTHNMYDFTLPSFTVNENVTDLAQDIVDASSEDSDSEALSSIGALPGDKILVEAGIIKLGVNTPGWGFSLFSNALVDLTIQNPAVPFFETQVYGQVGLLGGIGFSFFDRKLDVGVVGKAVFRAGVKDTFRISDETITEALDDMSEGDQESASNRFTEKAGSVGRFAPDFGATYHIDSIPNLHTKWSVVVQNIGELDFGAAGTVPMTVTTGIATESEFAAFDLILAADYFDMLHQTTKEDSTARNIKLGAELGWLKLFNGHHLFAVRAGMNGPYPTYGFTANLFGLKFDLAQWSQEIGDIAGSKEDKRYSLEITLIF